MATTTNECLIHEGNITSIRMGSVIVSLYTTSQSGEISPEIFDREDVNIFLDYELNKTFTEDMRKANNLGYLDQVIYFRNFLLEGKDIDLGVKINIVRLMGTPIQNVAVLDMILEERI
jgi:hypothetical protein